MQDHPHDVMPEARTSPAIDEILREHGVDPHYGWVIRSESEEGDSTEKPHVVQSDTELCVMLDLPDGARKQIHGWVLEQDWPEGTDLHEPEKYHITLMYTPDGHEAHKDADWIEHLDSVPVRIVGIDVFTEAPEKGFPYVLRLSAPEVKRHAEEMQRRAEDHGLEITHFPGGYKPHITVGYGPDDSVATDDVVELEFHAGPSVISEPREDENPDSKESRFSQRGEESAVRWNLDGHDGVIPSERTAVKAPEPPRYRAASGKDRCGTCKMSDDGVCWGYGNKKVESFYVCDSYASAPGYHEAATTYGEAQLLDQLSLSSVAHNLHYKFEETQDPAALKGYAERLLRLIGYEPDELNTMAALQAWQTLYPGDQMSPSGDRAGLSPSGGTPELPETAESGGSQAPPTVPSASWEYGTTSGHSAPDLVKSLHADNSGIHDRSAYPRPAGLRGGVWGVRGVRAGDEVVSPPAAGGWGAADGLPGAAQPGDAGGQEDAVGLLAGSGGGSRAAGWQRAAFVYPELQSILDAFLSRYGLTLLGNEDDRSVTFWHIEVPPQNRGNGAGSRFMAQLKSYCDRRGKALTVQQVKNIAFFSSLGYLQQVAPETWSYTPAAPRQEDPEEDQANTEPTPTDRWPEYGDRPEDERLHYDVSIGNDVLV